MLIKLHLKPEDGSTGLAQRIKPDFLSLRLFSLFFGKRLREKREYGKSPDCWEELNLCHVWGALHATEDVLRLRPENNIYSSFEETDQS